MIENPYIEITRLKWMVSSCEFSARREIGKESSYIIETKFLMYYWMMHFWDLTKTFQEWLEDAETEEIKVILLHLLNNPHKREHEY